MDHFALGEPQKIVIDKNRNHAVFVLFENKDGEAVLQRFKALGYTSLGLSDSPHKDADVFGQVIPTPDRDEHLLCLTPVKGNTEAFLGPDESVLAFSIPLSLYQERKVLLQRYIDLSTRFFTADNKQAHSLIDQADALLAQLR
jgi:hypothetical protein